MSEDDKDDEVKEGVELPLDWAEDELATVPDDCMGRVASACWASVGCCCWGGCCWDGWEGVLLIVS